MVVEENRSPVHSEECEDTPAIPRIPSMIALSAKIFNERITVKFSRNEYKITEKPTYTSVTTINNSQTTGKEGGNYSDTENSLLFAYGSSDHKKDSSGWYDSEAMPPRTRSPTFHITSPRGSYGLENSTSEEVNECEFCNKSYRKKKRLLKHKRKRHVERNNYSCKYCSRVFFSRPGWSYHVTAVHENRKKYICNYCEKSYLNKGHLSSHINKKHQHFDQHLCHFCATVFPDEHKLRMHKEVHRIYKCDFCSIKGFFRIHRLQRHIDLEHPSTSTEKEPIHEKDPSSPIEESNHDESPISTEEEPIYDHPPTCTEEEPIYDDPSTPEKESKNVEPVLCEYCDKIFPSAADLQRHWKITGENLFICGKCLHVSEDALSFSHHLLKHSEEKIFMCTLCSKTFVTMDLLEDHFTTHAGFGI